KGGQIVNISSIGGKMPVPHLSAYCASKFALAGFSQTVAAELAREGIKVTTVFPALMRTGSAVQAVFKGDHEREYEWFAAASAVPGLTISAEKAARQILAAVKRGDSEITLSLPAKFASFFFRNFPALFTFVNGLVAAALPR